MRFDVMAYSYRRATDFERSRNGLLLGVHFGPTDQWLDKTNEGNVDQIPRQIEIVIL